MPANYSANIHAVWECPCNYVRPRKITPRIVDLQQYPSTALALLLSVSSVILRRTNRVQNLPTAPCMLIEPCPMLTSTSYHFAEIPQIHQLLSLVGQLVKHSTIWMDHLPESFSRTLDSFKDNAPESVLASPVSAHACRVSGPSFYNHGS